MKPRPPVLFRCDGSPEIGLGHVMRCLALANELREVHGCQIAFAMQRGPLGFGLVKQNGYRIFGPPDPAKFFDASQWLLETIRNVGAQVLVLDVRDNLPREGVEALRKQGILIATLDDSSERRLAADLAFYPPVPQVENLEWTDFSGKLYVGWEWVVLGRDIAHCPTRVAHSRPVVLVTMGGSDPAGLTLRAVAALELLEEDFETKVMLGPGFSHHEALKKLVAGARRKFEVHENLADLIAVMAQADLAVASFGVTAYELAAMGVPAIHLCLTDDHAISASMFEDHGLALNMGAYSGVLPKQVAEAVRDLLADPAGRERMARAGQALVDGRGAERVAAVIVHAISDQPH